MTVATLVTVGTMSARRHVAVAAVAGTSVAQVQPAAPAPAAAVKPPTPAKSTVIAAAEPVTPYRSGAFDPEPRVEPLPPFKDEPKPMTRSASVGGGSGLVASSGGPAGVSTFTTPAYGSARVGGAMPQQLPIPQSSPRSGGPTLASIAPGSSGSSGSRGSASAVASSETPSKTRTPAETPVTEPPVVGGKGHKSWPDLPPVGPLPPEPMPLVHDPLPRTGHVDEPQRRIEAPPPPPAKERVAQAEEYPRPDDPERGKRIVALAMRYDDRDQDFGFGVGRGHGRIRRAYFEDTVIHAVTARGHSRRTSAQAAIVVPRFEPAEMAGELAASMADCPPMTDGKSLDPVAIATTPRENDSFATPFVRAFGEKRVMAYEAPAAAAADYAFAASPALIAEAVPEPSGLAVVAVAGLCGVLARRTRRR